MRRIDELHLEYLGAIAEQSSCNRRKPDVARLSESRRRFDRSPYVATLVKRMGKFLSISNGY
jgi:hypothetical protein